MGLLLGTALLVAVHTATLSGYVDEGTDEAATETIEVPVEAAPVPVTDVRFGRYAFTIEDVRQAVATGSPTAGCIIRGEIGPNYHLINQLGSQGEVGPAQLHPRGLLVDFYRRGFTDPWNPYQAVRYVDVMIANGQARQHWPTMARC